MATKRVIISRHVVFDETCFPFGLYPSRSSHSDLDFLIAGTTVPVRPASLPSAAGSPPSSSIEELTDDPAILFHGPVLPAAPPAAAPAAPSPATSPAAAPPFPVAAPPAAVPRDIRFVYSRRPRGPDGSSTAQGSAPAPAPAPAPAQPPPASVQQAPAPIQPAAAPVQQPTTSAAPSAPPVQPERRITRTQSGAIPVMRYVGLFATTTPSPLPSSYRGGLADPNWRAAMAEEYQTLIDNGTWRLVPRPPGANVVTDKWIFKHKYHSDGTLARHKAHWVVRGFSQRHGIDYDETFSPVVKPPPSGLSSALLPPTPGPFISLMSRTLSSMAI